MDKHRVADQNFKPLPVKSENIEILFEKQIQAKKEEEKEALKKIVQECFKEWCENTTSHGFSNIVKTDSWAIKLIWIALVIVSMGYCFWSLTVFIMNYAAFETIVNYQIIDESPTDYPAITICNTNPFDMGTEATTGTYLIEKLVANKISPSLTIAEGEFGITVVQETAKILKAAVTSDKNLTVESRKKLGFTMETMIISCYYNREVCSASDFVWYRDNEYGNCYTFNGLVNSNNSLVSSRTTSKSGPANGLILELFVGAPGKQDFYTYKKGIKVAVHRRGVIPMLNYEGLEVGTGLASNIAISRTNYSKLNAPYSDCRKNTETILSTDSQYYMQTLKLSKYSKKLCFEICMQYTQILPKCNCSDPNIPIVDTSQTICSALEDLKCVKSNRDRFDQLEIDEICGPYCPKECDSVVYQTSVSTSIYPTDYYGKLLESQTNIISKFNVENSFSPPSVSFSSHHKLGVVSSVNTTAVSITNTTSSSTIASTIASSRSSNSTTGVLSNQTHTGNSSLANGSTSNNGYKPVSMDDIKEGVLMLSIFLDDTKYTFIQENAAITEETLIGVIGGQFGLFMGASFLTFAEILEMLINLARLIARYRAAKKLMRKTNLIEFDKKTNGKMVN